MSTLSVKRNRDMSRQKWQFIAVGVTVVLGVMMFAATYDAYLNLGSSLQGTYERLHMADATVNGADSGFVDTAQGISGVDTAIERRQVDLPMEVGEYSLVGRIIGMPAATQPAVNQIDIDEGTYLDPDDPTAVVVEAHMAHDFGLNLGDGIVMAGFEATVVGIATSPEYLWPAKDAQTLFTPPNSFGVVFVDERLLEGVEYATIVDQVLVLYDIDGDTEETDGSVAIAADGANASEVQLLVDQPSNATIHLEIGGLQIMAIAFPLLFLAAAGMAIYVVITRIVFSQRGVIGTLRASGFTSKQMSRHYLSYGLRIGVIGAVIGAVIGTLMSVGMTAIYTAIFGIPDLVAGWHVPTILMALAFGAGAGTLAALPPARAVAQLPPAEAMRGDIPTGGGKRSIFETLIPPLRSAPIRWRMTLRGIGRNKRRSLALILGVVLGLTLILASWGMLDTMVLSIDRQFNEIAIEDASVVLSESVGDSQIAEIEAVSGVSDAEPVIGLSATIAHGDESYATLLEGYQTNTVMHGFPDGLPAEGALLGRAMSDILNVVVGDEITIDFPTLETTITTTVSGFVDELATLAYMDASSLASDLSDVDDRITDEVLALPIVTTVKVLYDGSAEPTEVVEALEQVPAVAVVVDSNEIRDLINTFQKFFYVFIGMMLFFGGAMAFALIFNIVSVNVAERAGEFASMRANGLTRRKVASMIVGEVFLLTAIGIVPGLLVGYIAAIAFTNSFSTDQFPLTAQIRPITFLGAAIAMFIVAGLSLIPAVRSVNRINVGEIVRERAV